MTEKLITVLISNYNYAPYVGQAIDSALAQTYPRIEVVVVDDGSTDNSREILNGYGDKIRAVFKENGGQGSALNCAFAHCTGDIVMLLDADDYLRPTAAARLASVWKEDTGIVHHRLQMVRDGNEIDLNLPDRSVQITTGDVASLVGTWGLTYRCPPTSGRAYSRSVLGRAMPIPEKEYRSGADDYLRVITPFYSPVFALDETLAYYRIHTRNSYAGGVPRRLMKRAKLEQRLRVLRQAYVFATKMAEERHMEVPNQATFYRARDLFEFLLHDLTGPTPMGRIARLKKGWTIVRNLWAVKEYSFKRRVRETLVLFLVCVSPRWALKWGYPNLFSQ